ncbi:MAG: universal stress protein [Chloroflexi bacterium]|nr:universal stress protein [Chloroflexota bacterium]
MYSKLLVPVDGSLLAEAALPYAAQLAAGEGCEVTLAYVAPAGGGGCERMHELYLEKLGDLLKAMDGARGARTLAVRLAGEPAEKIVEYADQVHVDLIVMTTHGASGIRRWALGSVADKVVRSTARPVFLVRSKECPTAPHQLGPMKRVVMPLDGSKEAEAVIPFMEEIASAAGMEVVVLQALPTGYPSVVALGYEHNKQLLESERAAAGAYLGGIVDRFKQKGVPTRAQVRVDGAAGGILKVVKEEAADLVAMTTHGRSGVSRWVLGSVADRILREGATPLLLVRPPARSG